VGTLAVFDRAGDHIDAAIVVELDEAERRRRRQRGFEDAGQPAATAGTRRHRALQRRLVSDRGRHPLEAFADADAVHALAGHADVALAEDVLAPERERAHPELARHAVHLLLARPRHLRDAEAAEATARLSVGVDE